MLIAPNQFVVLAAGDSEGLFKLIVPIVIAIFYIIAAIGKARKGTDEQESEEEKPSQPAQRPAPQQQPQRPQPMRTPGPIPQRPVPQQGPRPMQTPGPVRPIPRPMTQRPTPAPPRPVPTQRHPQEVFEKVTRPIPTATPTSVGRLEDALKDKAVRAEKEPAKVLKAEEVIDHALKPTVVPPAEVMGVQPVEEVVDLGEVETDLRSLHKLREAIILKEILDKPLALR